MSLIENKAKVDLIDFLSKIVPRKDNETIHSAFRILTKREEFLNNMHFVEDTSGCFLYLHLHYDKRKNESSSELKYFNVTVPLEEKALYNAIVHGANQLYISLDFKDILNSKNIDEFLPYKIAQSSNPHSQREKLNQQLFSANANLFLDEVNENAERFILEKKIDEALKNKDEKAFYELTNQLNALDRIEQ